jgi:predicted pyridoxine 5'-phosphate oxidase superfamily flavin-nucleotide-binding protein
MNQGERQLQDHLGTRERADAFYDRQVRTDLNEPMRRFVERQEMMFLATADASGSCDNTFRAGPPGFVRVLDEHRITWPEYRGNGVLASLGNITENPYVGLLFIDFQEVVGLHVNGTAELVEDPDMPVDPVPGRRAKLWVVARVEEAYIHCAKHIPRMVPMPRGGGHHTDVAQPKKSDYFAPARDRGSDQLATSRPRATAARPARTEPRTLPIARDHRPSSTSRTVS